MRRRTFSHGQAARYYDWLGAKLDTQAFYEAAAQRDLADHMALETCRAVVEFGCGTGRFAAELLRDRLPESATYLGLDVSAKMTALAEERLADYADRVTIRQTDGGARIDAPDAAFDRFLCTYVLELLSNNEIEAVLAEAHRVLAPGGLLGIAVLTRGPTAASRLVSTVWSGLHRLSPWIVGGCRPITLEGRLAGEAWRPAHRNVVTAACVPSEVVVAERD